MSLGSMATAVTRQVACKLGRRSAQPLPSLGILYGQTKDYCSDTVVPKTNQRKTLTNYKRGKGGRSSFSGNVATVFGPTGFLGRFVINQLGKVGTQLVIPYRGDGQRVLKFRVAADLGQTVFFPIDLRNEDSLRTAMMHSNIVINLISSERPTRNWTMTDVNVDGVRRIAKIAKQCGVEQFVHISALNASPDPPKIYLKDGCEFLKTKYYGEKAVREEFPEAIVFRPADIYGPVDKFLHHYATFERTEHHRNVQLWKMGTETIKQPVFVSDLVQGIMRALENPDSIGETYEAVGNARFYLSDLIDFINACMRHDLCEKKEVTKFFLWRLKMFPKYHHHMDKFEREFITDVTTDCPTLEDLGVQLTRLQDRTRFEMRGYKKDSYFEELMGQFNEPPDPPEAYESPLAAAS